MNDAATDLNALEDALRPFKDVKDPAMLFPDCLIVVRQHITVAAKLAAYTIYQFEGLTPAAVLTVIDPTRKPLLARILPTKKIHISSADSLIVFLTVALQQVVNPGLSQAVATFVFLLLYGPDQGDITRDEIVAMGHVTAWLAYQHAREAVAVADLAGL